MTLVILLIIAVLIYYFFIYKDNYKRLSSRNGSKKCPNCGNDVEDSFNICPICKETLKKKCSSCGENIEVSWNFCPYCESRLAKGDRK